MDIDQVIFCWSAHSLVGTRGVGPVATSLAPDQLHIWNQRLAPDIWAADEPPGGPAGLSYLRYHTDAAIVHKLPVADESGRPGATFTHVLVGPAHVLTAPLALGLAEWRGWRLDREALPADGALNRLPAEALQSAEPELTSLTYEQAAPLLARILAEPEQRFSVVAPTVPVTGLLRVVLDVLGDLAGEWTFATRESADTGSKGPRLIFLIRDPGFSSHGGRRIRVHVAEPQEDRTPYADLAVTLLDSHRRGGTTVIAEIRPRLASADIAQWARTIQIAPGVLADAGWLVTLANRGDASQRERAFLTSEPGRSFISGALDSVADRDLSTLLSAWAWDRADSACRSTGEVLLRTGLRRCLCGLWPLPELLQGVRDARPDRAAIRAALLTQLNASPKGFSKSERMRRHVTAIAVATMLDPTLAPARPEFLRFVTAVPAAEVLSYADRYPEARSALVRMVVDTSRSRRMPDQALRYEIEAHGFFATDVAAHYGAGAVDALATLLELAYGERIARSADDVRHILARMVAPRGAEDSAVLVAIGLRTLDAGALLVIEHELALRVFRQFKPGYQPAGHRSERPADGQLAAAAGAGGRVGSGAGRGRWWRRVPAALAHRAWSPHAEAGDGSGGSPPRAER